VSSTSVATTKSNANAGGERDPHSDLLSLSELNLAILGSRYGLAIQETGWAEAGHPLRAVGELDDRKNLDPWHWLPVLTMSRRPGCDKSLTGRRCHRGDGRPERRLASRFLRCW